MAAVTHQVGDSRATFELQFDLSGDVLAKLEADLALYEQAWGEKISDGLRVGTVQNQVTDTELATHLLNSERFRHGPSFDESLWMSRVRRRRRELTRCVVEPMTRSQHRRR